MPFSISTRNQPFARESPKISGQESWPLKSTNTSSLPPRLGDLPHSPPLALLNLSLSNSHLSATRVVVSLFLYFCPSAAINDHYDSPLPTQTRPSTSFHSAVRTISHLVAESLYAINND